MTFRGDGDDSSGRVEDRWSGGEEKVGQEEVAEMVDCELLFYAVSGDTVVVNTHHTGVVEHDVDLGRECDDSLGGIADGGLREEVDGDEGGRGAGGKSVDYIGLLAFCFHTVSGKFRRTLGDQWLYFLDGAAQENNTGRFGCWVGSEEFHDNSTKTCGCWASEND